MDRDRYYLAADEGVVGEAGSLRPPACSNALVADDRRYVLSVGDEAIVEEFTSLKAAAEHAIAHYPAPMLVDANGMITEYDGPCAGEFFFNEDEKGRVYVVNGADEKVELDEEVRIVNSRNISRVLAILRAIPEDVMVQKYDDAKTQERLSEVAANAVMDFVAREFGCAVLEDGLAHMDEFAVEIEIGEE